MMIHRVAMFSGSILKRPENPVKNCVSFFFGSI